MLSFFLLCFFGLIVANSTIISLPGHSQNGTELLDLFLTNATLVGNNRDPTDNASLSGYPIDQNFRTVIDIYADIKISGKSTYMSILKAMIELSFSEGTHAYTGEAFSFRNYSNVKIKITPVRSSSSTLQYRYAVWGLFKAALYFATSSRFTCISVELNWSRDGRPALVGTIDISPNPLPDVVGSTEVRKTMRIGQRAGTPSSSPDVAKFTSIDDEETDLAALTNVRKFAVFVELQGQALTIPAVFMTLFLGLVHIASFEATNLVRNFKVQDSLSKTELVYEHYGALRTSPPLFTYQAAARALGYLPKYMFAQGKFEAVIFVLEVEGTPVGIGHLRKASSTFSLVSDDA